jgi:hypothetical protein
LTSLIPSSDLPCSRFDRRSNANVRSTTAQIATHRFLNILVRWFPDALEQCNGAHDLTALAVAALDHVFVNPRILHDATDGII